MRALDHIRAGSKWAPWLVLALVYAWLVPNVVLYLLHNNLLRGDGAGHLFLIEFTAERLLPGPSGWCDTVWGGFAAGQLYPPLFHYLAAWLSFAVGSVISVKILMSAVWLAVPGAAYLVARRLTTQPIEQAAVLLAVLAGFNGPSALLGTPLALGTNLGSGMGNGMFPSTFGACLFLLYLGTIIPASTQCRSKSLSPCSITLQAVLLGATVLAHAVWGLVAAVCTLAAAGCHLAVSGQGQRKPAVVHWGLVIGLAFLLSGVFSVPFLAHRDLLSPIFLPSLWRLQVWIPFWLLVLLAVVLRKRLTPGLCFLVLSCAAVVLPVPLAEAVEAPFHFLRLTIPMAVLGLPALILLAQRAVPRYGLHAGLAAALALAVATVALSPPAPRGNPDMEVPRFKPDATGTVLVLSRDGHTPGYHALPYLTAGAGAAVSHGISVESAPHALLIFRLLEKLDPDVFTWGVNARRNRSLITVDPKHQFTAAQLAALNITHILTDAKLPQGLAQSNSTAPVVTFPNYFWTQRGRLERLSADHTVSPDGSKLEFYLYQVGSGNPIASDRSVLGVSEDLFPKAQYAWFASGAGQPMPAVWPHGTVEACRLSSIENPEFSQDNVISFSVTTEVPGAVCPVWVKTAWHPHWEVFGPEGTAGPYKAGTGMVVLAPAGRLQLQYGPGACDLVGLVFTLAGLLACALVAVHRAGRKF